MKHLKIAATADGGLVIEGYGVPFGGPIKGKDLHGQFFSKNTDFALDLIPDGQRPLLYQHGLDDSIDTSVIGRWGVKKIDDGGVWVRAQLDARSEYVNEIKELVDQDALGFSSGTMGHLVKVSPKTGEILKWALVELSLTPNPANPNAYIVKANKSAAEHVKSLIGTKHGDHDQSDHGNWASGGGHRYSDKAQTLVKDFLEKAGRRGGQFSADKNREQANNQAREIFHLAQQWNTDKPLTTINVATGDKRPLNGWPTAEQNLEKIAQEPGYQHLPSDHPARVAEEARAALAKQVLDELRGGQSKPTRSVKHGDHDQSEHGNWAHGGGNDGERGKHDPELSSGAWRGMQNIATDAANIQKYSSTVGDFAREMALDMKGDGNPNAAAAWEQVARHAMDIGGTAYTVEESVRENPHGESARQVVNSIDQNAQTMDQSRIVLREFLRVAQANSNSTLPEEVSNALFKLDSSVTAVRYNSGFITQQQSSEFGPKTFRVKRSTKHGDHDQSEHGNWAHGGGSGSDSGREKTGDEKGVYGWSNRATYTMGLMADGAFEDDARQALEDNSGDRDAAARDLGMTMQAATEDQFNSAGLDDPMINSVVTSGVERIDWNDIADAYIRDAGGSSTYDGSGFRNDGEEEHNGWTNRSTWLTGLHIGEGLLGGSDDIHDLAKEILAKSDDPNAARYELAKELESRMDEQLSVIQESSNGGAQNLFVQDMFGQQIGEVNWTEVAKHAVDAVAPEGNKTFRVKRSVKHGDHD